ncbi:MBL fold metallo-hydrolase [Sphingobacteriaceae bacterium WQ 2009]|uniref:MBL fold metallo-hydrolase n=1 Tax=Rhinopithecimicrobium faecis TaxID=2820698 RepID=A0A8T4H8J5_9SPHI|nr:MBL fold metallo-hydrolase [Sphingobacteriaceae bacterium WQ 2009]
MKYAAIASGSNGNCYYIAQGEDIILVDAGINCKHMELRMLNLGINPAQVKALFITHEHTDHIKGLSVFCKRYQIPVYLTAGTYAGSKLRLPEELVHLMAVDGEVQIGALTVQGIPKFHDAKEPCSFMVSNGQHQIAVLTDLGRACEHVIAAVSNCHVLFLEANYDAEMLAKGRYSYFLKNRISGGWGHISNASALAIFTEHRSESLQHLILSHLSGQNNTVEIVETLFAPHCNGIQLTVATREKETELFDCKQLRVNNALIFAS